MPGDRCSSCHKFMSPTEGIRCQNCCVLQHRSCAGLSAKSAVSPTWRCRECKKLRHNTAVPNVSPSGNSITTSHSTRQDTEAEKSGVTNRDILGAIKELRLEFTNFRKEISDLKAGVQTCLQRMDSLEARIDALEQQTLTKYEPPSDVNDVINKLKSDINDRDQDLLANDLEFRDVPEERDENTAHLVMSIAAKLGVKLENWDIISAERFGGRSLDASNSEGTTESRPRVVVARFARRALRDELLNKARVRRTGDKTVVSHMGKTHRFYINERLTSTNRRLFRLARVTGRRNGWQFIWTKHGRILARRSPSDTVVRIRVENDIVENIGPLTDML